MTEKTTETSKEKVFCSECSNCVKRIEKNWYTEGALWWRKKVYNPEQIDYACKKLLKIDTPIESNNLPLRPEVDNKNNDCTHYKKGEPEKKYFGREIAYDYGADY